MTLTELKYIVALAREKHFGRAAEACFVSQPTLSVAIRKLEDELGVQLFERGTAGIQTTAIGDQLIEQAQKVLDEASFLKDLARQGRDPLAGPLRVGVIFTIGPYLLPWLVPQMIQTYPNMPMLLQENYTVKLLESLRQGEVDVLILAEPFDMQGLVIDPVYDEHFMVAVPRQHPWAKRRRIPSTELTQQTMLLLGSGHCFRDQVVEICPELSRFSQATSGIQKTFEGSSLETIRHMVASGVGITVLPQTACPRARDDGFLCYIPFEAPAPSRRVVLAWRKSFARPAAIQALKRQLQALDLPVQRINFTTPT
ncbi:MAG: LysR family transcriptional regulator [Betaproteobacteria bacterium]|jgi:LysR family hydrogen peroxide-inducible transcriptional activator|nr:LysR family transcriptional regulator [Pseudomonadota bacterium]NBO96148.1 LysR family transcriptional regulator [Betaproteobacteria bacterium]NDG05466.1 LysR family transcriptional regulator [Alphaproteobacteria bacterium]NBP35003.1 LysR family transcriptional regulator [Betaproteobacteria bacterium]NBP37717.1 LysR family transcriptional regulator [Betaproteobacteria bacterium]